MVCLNKIKTNLDKWMSKPVSFDGKISITKIMVLPLTNFLSSMLYLNPPKGYWDKLHSLISELIWTRKTPRIKLEMFQREKLAGGWGLPNFKIFHCSFILRTIKAWLDPSNSTSWRSLEAKLIYRCRLLLLGGRPSAYPIWSNNGIHTLGQLFNTYGLPTFDDLYSITV